jgi:hypothetical protein
VTRNSAQDVVQVMQRNCREGGVTDNAAAAAMVRISSGLTFLSQLKVLIVLCLTMKLNRKVVGYILSSLCQHLCAHKYTACGIVRRYTGQTRCNILYDLVCLFLSASETDMSWLED